MTILMSMTLSLTFTQSVKRVLCQKHSSFSGRACRSEYWNFFYFQIIILLIYELFIIMAAIYEIKAEIICFEVSFLTVRIAGSITGLGGIC